MNQNKELFLQGIPISRGIAIGMPFLFSPIVSVPKEEADSSDLNSEEQVRAYQKARQESLEELQEIRTQLLKEEALEAAAIVEGQEQILLDPLFEIEIAKEIREGKKSAKEVILSRLDYLKGRFSSLSNPYIQDRYRDIEDVGQRLIQHLQQEQVRTLSNVPESSVVFAQDLTTSDTASAKTTHVSGFVTKEGSIHSHAAIIAKAKGIPYVGGVKGEWETVSPTSTVILDGRAGMVILNPSDATLARYRLLEEQIASRKTAWVQIRDQVCQTWDGKRLLCTANIETVKEGKELSQYGAEGVGLFRSEFLLFGRHTIPSEEEQVVHYRSLVEAVASRPVTIRVFDIRGDKFFFSPLSVSKSVHFFEGASTRFFEEHEDEAKKQCRALLRAAVAGPIQVLFPMIASVEEMRRAKAILEKAREELLHEGISFGDEIKIGAMIEIPSAAMTADLIAQEADFLAIGTNDLLQYAMAKDRGQTLNQPFDTDACVSLLRYLHTILTHAHRSNTHVKLCGDLANDPRMTLLLVGMGFHELSVPLRSVPLLKHIIRHTSFVEAELVANDLLKVSDGAEILNTLTDLYKTRFPEDFFCSFPEEEATLKS